MATPGLRLIQDLLAKSVAKWSGDATYYNDESKRKRSDQGDAVYRKKQCKKFTETVVKLKDEKYKNVKIETNKIKVEYCETNPVLSVAKIEAREVKREYTEFDISKFQIKIQANDGLKRKQFDAENENCMKKQKKEHNEPNDKGNRSENWVTRIKNEEVSENKETDYNFHNLKQEVNEFQDIEQTNEDKSLIMKLLKKSAAKYTGNKDDLNNFKKEKIDKDGKFDKIEKKQITKSNMHLKTEDNEVKIKKDIDIQIEITFKKEATIEGQGPDGKSYIKRLLNRSEAKYTENHDDGHRVKEENIDKKDEKVKKIKVMRTKKIQLKEENVEEYENYEDDYNQRKSKKSKACKQIKAYSPEEDEIITTAMDTFGDHICIRNLAKDLHRTWASIENRIAKLKTGKRQKEHKAFSLTEDLVIMDRVLESLSGKTRQEINFDGTSARQVATALGRTEVSTRKRWGYQLKPWILQYYSGTLNLNIRRMLANYLADTFDSLDSIDWCLVARRPKFAGHTQGSLRTLFFTVLFKSTTKNYQNLEKTEITLKNIADNANVAFSEKNCRKVSANVLMRQEQVIDYFEQYVKKHGITNFL